jgi:hypothetical protein
MVPRTGLSGASFRMTGVWLPPGGFPKPLLPFVILRGPPHQRPPHPTLRAATEGSSLRGKRSASTCGPLDTRSRSFTPRQSVVPRRGRSGASFRMTGGCLPPGASRAGSPHFVILREPPHQRSPHPTLRAATEGSSRRGTRTASTRHPLNTRSRSFTPRQSAVPGRGRSGASFRMTKTREELITSNKYPAWRPAAHARAKEVSVWCSRLIGWR